MKRILFDNAMNGFGNKRCKCFVVQLGACVVNLIFFMNSVFLRIRSERRGEYVDGRVRGRDGRGLWGFLGGFVRGETLIGLSFQTICGFLSMEMMNGREEGYLSYS